jgi:hypothetical protein
MAKRPDAAGQRDASAASSAVHSRCAGATPENLTVVTVKVGSHNGAPTDGVTDAGRHSFPVEVFA